MVQTLTVCELYTRPCVSGQQIEDNLINRMESASFKRIEEIPMPTQTHRLTGVHGCAASRYVASLAEKSTRIIVLVAKDAEAARQYEEELQFFSPNTLITTFPDYETLPYDRYSPPPSLVSERLKALYHLPTMNTGVLVVPIRTILQRLVPTNYVQSQSFVLSVGDRFDIQERRIGLQHAGYRQVDTVYEPGEYTVRGAIVDLYPLGTEHPIRIETFDDEVESLRFFNVETQVSTQKVDEISILPASEIRIEPEGIKQFRNAWHDHFDEDVRYCTDYQDISNGVVPDGIECYLPLFFENTATLFDYLSTDSIFVIDEGARTAGDSFWEEIGARFESLKYDPQRPLLPPQELYIRVEEASELWNKCSKYEIVSDDSSKKYAIDLQCQAMPNIEANRRSSTPLARLQEHMGSNHCRTLFVAETEGRREFLSDFLSKSGITPIHLHSLQAFKDGLAQTGLVVAPIERSCRFSDFDLICESDIFATHSSAVAIRSRKKVIDPSLVIRNLFEIEDGTPVVHIDHGVGIYRGLATIDVHGIANEFLTLEYANGDLLRIPVTNLHLITRYVGADEESIKIDRLGSDRWQKVKNRAERRVQDVAAELLSMFARRELSKSHAFTTTDSEYEIFCDQCEFQLTEDQMNAVDAILSDLSSTKSMDRMVCGDVGFGKTEVAMRAAFHVAIQGKQVMLLVPTTVLARQHFETFSDRFADWPINIDFLSRHRTAKDRNDIIERIGNGSLDVIIGTHQLLNQDIHPHDLGLLIVDEEHRFGVRAKERLRQMQVNVNLLTLTATPIPRTLNLTLEGLRDLSLIETAPEKRLAIRTFVSPHDWQQIKDAIVRELDRGGQVYYLHNRIQSIDGVAQKINELVPSARVLVAHGAMPKATIEHAMSEFYHRRANVLVCTTIIESGIDVPNANTIIIERADTLGLAQLHQIRGRVGRSHHQAYAYLTTVPELAMTTTGKRRLEAITQADELGAGFKLALEDMQIRGAGELLGQQQSGEIMDVGYDFYIRMLEETIEAMKSNRVPDLDKPFQLGHDIDLRIPAMIPHDYLPDVKARLIFYKRISNAFTKLEVDHLMAEAVDRFGALPDALQNLFRITKIKLDAVERGISTVRISDVAGTIEFVDPTLIDVTKLLVRIQNPSAREKFELTNASKSIKIRHTYRDAESRIAFIEEFMQAITLVPETPAKVA